MGQERVEGQAGEGGDNKRQQGWGARLDLERWMANGSYAQ